MVVLVLGACAPVPNDAELAQQTLTSFFELLYQGEYEEADELFGGDRQVMSGVNPSLDPDDHSAAWKNVCTINGFQCLPVRTAVLKEMRDGAYIFTVEFSNLDGSVFVLGPCCGATEDEMLPVSRFEYRVRKTTAGEFVVLDLPVYVP